MVWCLAPGISAPILSLHSSSVFRYVQCSGAHICSRQIDADRPICLAGAGRYSSSTMNKYVRGFSWTTARPPTEEERH